MSSATYDQPLTCSAGRALKSIFNGPNWTSNLLWLTIAALLQSFVVGSIFLFGYGASLLRARAGLPDRNSPDIDSSRLGDYFMQGLWPFLVYLVASLVASVILTIPLAFLFVILAVIGAQFGEAGAIVSIFFIVPLVFFMTISMVILLGPITIRAMICQDFQRAFDIGWCISFVKLTYREMILSSIVFSILGIGVYIVGLALLCVGIFPAIGLLTGAMMHLLAQWYELFLSRGGEPVQPPAETVVDASLV
ncbi:MAG: DUF4013 domain-containing protein [Pirellulaceae bacterium]|nr:DUF4013 domain-containing protein [Pirellulaceae bacterium]